MDNLFEETVFRFFLSKERNARLWEALALDRKERKKESFLVGIEKLGCQINTKSRNGGVASLNMIEGKAKQHGLVLDTNSTYVMIELCVPSHARKTMRTLIENCEPLTVALLEKDTLLTAVSNGSVVHTDPGDEY